MLAKGETEQRLFALDAWRETPFYTDGERNAFAWPEELAKTQRQLELSLCHSFAKYLLFVVFAPLSFKITVLSLY